MNAKRDTIWWTLVEHSGHVKPGFTHAVEEAAVTRKGMVEKIREAGGCIFDSYEEASTREYAENYPPGIEGVYPHATGTFINILIDGRRLYIPQRDSEPHMVGMDAPTQENDPGGRFSNRLDEFSAIKGKKKSK